VKETDQPHDKWMTPVFALCVVFLFICLSSNPTEVESYIASFRWTAAHRNAILEAFQVAVAIGGGVAVILGVIVIGGWYDRNRPKSANPFDDWPEW